VLGHAAGRGAVAGRPGPDAGGRLTADLPRP
jgi:hypothetical protein